MAAGPAGSPFPHGLQHPPGLRTLLLALAGTQKVTQQQQLVHQNPDPALPSSRGAACAAFLAHPRGAVGAPAGLEAGNHQRLSTP